MGETFSGVDYETGVRAAQEFADLVAKLPFDATPPAQVALAWVAQQLGVTTVIPGARSVAHAKANGRRRAAATRRGLHGRRARAIRPGVKGSDP